MTKIERAGLIFAMIGLAILVGLICVVAFHDYGIVLNTIATYVIAQITLILSEIVMFKMLHEGGKE